MSRPLPSDMVKYLLTFLSPPDPHPGAMFIPDIQEMNWSSVKDETVTGILAVGTPTEEDTAEMMRVLKPGAHMLVVAPEGNPLGHRGAVNLEDGGFEIRDTILVVEDATDPFHYVPKVGRAEREAGCGHLPGKSGAEATGRKEGSDGLRSPRAGASRTVKEVHNDHPTLKPWRLLHNLLRDVPQGHILDPFMGTASTGIACLRTGHDFTGIDMTPEYVEIATARLEHWSQVHPGQRLLNLQTEKRYAAEALVETEPNLFDLMFEGE